MRLAITSLLLAAASVMHAQTIHLRPGGFGGDGSKLNPLQIFSAEHYDAVLRRINQDTNITEIVHEAGVFYTLGLWNYAPGYTTFTRPIILRGAGMYNTVIKLAPDAVTHTDLKDRPDLTMFRFGVPFRNNGGPWLVEDLTIDGNRASFGTNRAITGGLSFHANGVICRRVRIVNLNGSTKLPNSPEGFGILVNNFQAGAYGGPDGGNLIEDCLFESLSDQEEYLSPFYIGVRDFGRPMLMSTIRNCTVLGRGQRPLRLGISLSSWTIVSNNQIFNAQYGLYNDTGTITNSIAAYNRFFGLTYAATFLVLDLPKQNITVENNEFNFSPSTNEWIGLTLWDKFGTGSIARDVIVRSNIFSGISDRPFTPLSLKGNITNVLWTNNIIPPNSLPVNLN